MEALRSDAFYIGAIGSRANNARRRERLKTFDITDEQLRKLHGPIGIYIGSKTPAEIAVSIIAEMTAVRHGVQLPATVNVEHAKRASETGIGTAQVAATPSTHAGQARSPGISIS
jgi:xanthine dehydrogenase accessory factor